MVETKIIDGLIHKSNTDLLGETRSAIFSPICKTTGISPYRYRLAQIWDESKAPLSWLMLNPSTADEFKNDPTVERCERRARAGGYGGSVVYNIFAFRATDPKNMRAHADPIGPKNDEFIMALAEQSKTDDVVGGWGGHGDHLSRGNAVYDMFKQKGGHLKALKTTKAGHPSHPLYISYALTPFDLF